MVADVVAFLGRRFVVGEAMMAMEPHEGEWVRSEVGEE